MSWDDVQALVGVDLSPWLDAVAPGFQAGFAEINVNQPSALEGLGTLLTEERLDDKNLRISPENYHQRKERYTQRIDAMVSYASGITKCRSISLLEYFGEKNATRCGKCDVCTSRNELDMSKYQFDQILDQIKANMQNNSVALEFLVDSVKFPAEMTTKVIRWLLDNGKILKDKDELMHWNTKGNTDSTN